MHVTITRTPFLGSFNGRTADSDSAYGGSNPSPRVILDFEMI